MTRRFARFAHLLWMADLLGLAAFFAFILVAGHRQDGRWNIAEAIAATMAFALFYFLGLRIVRTLRGGQGRPSR